MIPVQGDSTAPVECHSAEWEHQGRTVRLVIEEVETCTTLGLAPPEAPASDIAPPAPPELSADVVILAYSKTSERSLQRYLPLGYLAPC